VSKPQFIRALAIAMLAVTDAGAQSDPWVDLRFLGRKMGGEGERRTREGCQLS
jgi:hypothetical protein